MGTVGAEAQRLLYILLSILIYNKALYFIFLFHVVYVKSSPVVHEFTFILEDFAEIYIQCQHLVQKVSFK